jgi:hypothetical protein
MLIKLFGNSFPTDPVRILYWKYGFCYVSRSLLTYNDPMRHGNRGQDATSCNGYVPSADLDHSTGTTQVFTVVDTRITAHEAHLPGFSRLENMARGL